MRKGKQSNTRTHTATSSQPTAASSVDAFGCCSGHGAAQKEVFVFNDLYEFPERGDARGGTYMEYPNGDSDFLKKCTALGNNSPTLRRIIEDQVSLVLTKITGENEAVQEFVESPVNSAGDMLADVLEAYLYDRALYGNATLVVNRVNNIPRLRHIPAPRWRYKEEDQENVDTIFESDQFEGNAFWRGTDAALKPYLVNDHTAQTFAVTDRKYRPGSRYYNLPEWMPAALWAELEYRIARQNVSRFENDLMMSGALILKGISNKTEGESLIKNLVAAQAGTGKTGKMFVMATTADTADSQFIPWANEREGEFLELMDLAGQSIARAMGWPLALVGHSEAGQLGDVQQMRLAFDLVVNKFVVPRQNDLKRVISRIFKGSALEGMAVEFARPNPLSLAMLIDANSVMTDEQKQEALGLTKK